MNREVRLTQSAGRDLRKLGDFLDVKNPDAARRAVHAITTAILSLGEYAERGHAGPKPGHRQIPVPFGRSGYVIQYRISGETVVISRIRHALERP